LIHFFIAALYVCVYMYVYYVNYLFAYLSYLSPLVLWHCWLGSSKGMPSGL